MIVMKFGGASVAQPESFSHLADLIIERSNHYPSVVVVVSAMGNTTDQLIELAKKVHPTPPRREYDMLVTVGERISIALLAMALALKQRLACSFTGSQSGIITCPQHSEARIIEVKPHRILKSLKEGHIAIVAGFQGVSRYGEITTLGRGGSDTSAVALAAALGAERVEFYKPVEGIFNVDPNQDAQAQRYVTLSYSEALGIAQRGAKVMHPRAVALAEKNGIPLYVRSYREFPFSEEKGTKIFCSTAMRAPQPLYETIEEQIC